MEVTYDAGCGNTIWTESLSIYILNRIFYQSMPIFDSIVAINFFKFFEILLRVCVCVLGER